MQEGTRKWRRIGLGAALVLAASSGVARAQVGVCGDADGDGFVSIVDALLTAQRSAGLITLSPTGELCADVDEDGTIEITDALQVAQRAVRFVPPLDCCTRDVGAVIADQTGAGSIVFVFETSPPFLQRSSFGWQSTPSIQDATRLAFAPDGETLYVFDLPAAGDQRIYSADTSLVVPTPVEEWNLGPFAPLAGVHLADMAGNPVDPDQLYVLIQDFSGTGELVLKRLTRGTAFTSGAGEEWPIAACTAPGCTVASLQVHPSGTTAFVGVSNPTTPGTSLFAIDVTPTMPPYPAPVPALPGIPTIVDLTGDPNGILLFDAGSLSLTDAGFDLYGMGGFGTLPPNLLISGSYDPTSWNCFGGPQVSLAGVSMSPYPPEFNRVFGTTQNHLVEVDALSASVTGVASHFGSGAGNVGVSTSRWAFVPALVSSDELTAVDVSTSLSDGLPAGFCENLVTSGRTLTAVPLSPPTGSLIFGPGSELVMSLGN